MRELLDDTVKKLSLTNIFSLVPVIDFKTNKILCPECKTKLKVHHTDTRKVYSLHIGEFNAHRTFMFCCDCNTVYRPEEFETIVPPCSNVGYDVMIFIGRFVFCGHHTLEETLSELENRNIPICSSEIAYLARKFIIYLSILHQQAGLMLKMQLHQNGGYLLHIDGTSEGASPHLISAIDEVSHCVLANVKVPSEKKEQVVPFLKQIKECYGEPLAVTSDMGRAFLGAISEAFPGTANYICHFHFLRDLGKDLMEKEYSLIRTKLKHYGILSQLRYRLRYYFEDETQNIQMDQLYEMIETSDQTNMKDSRFIKQVCHILLLWVLDGKNHGNGFGFPFDRPHREFYQRLCLLFQKLKAVQKRCSDNKKMSRIIKKIIGDLTPLINDVECREAFQILSEKENVFDKLRLALAIASPNTTKGLNDNGEDIEISTIKSRVMKFKEDLQKAECYGKNKDYQKLINQIDKYWEMLFSDPIRISSPDGDFFIQPQRTNNIMEQFFRGIKRSYRRTTGNNSMCKKLQSMFADTPLVKNLDNPEYMRIILNGKKSLEEKFVEISHEVVITKMKDAQNIKSKIPRKIIKFLRAEETMAKLIYLMTG